MEPEMPAMIPGVLGRLMSEARIVDALRRHELHSKGGCQLAQPLLGARCARPYHPLGELAAFRWRVPIKIERSPLHIDLIIPLELFDHILADIAPRSDVVREYRQLEIHIPSRQVQYQGLLCQRSNEIDTRPRL